MNDPVFLSFAFVYMFAALATIVATFAFIPDVKSNRSMQMSPVRIRKDRYLK